MKPPLPLMNSGKGMCCGGSWLRGLKQVGSWRLPELLTPLSFTAWLPQVPSLTHYLDLSPCWSPLQWPSECTAISVLSTMPGPTWDSLWALLCCPAEPPSQEGRSDSSGAQATMARQQQGFLKLRGSPGFATAWVWDCGPEPGPSWGLRVSCSQEVRLNGFQGGSPAQGWGSGSDPGRSMALGAPSPGQPFPSGAAPTAFLSYPVAMAAACAQF